MTIIPFQAKFDKDFPTVSGNAEYNAECDLLRTMDQIIINSGIEDKFIRFFWMCATSINTSLFLEPTNRLD